MAARLGVRGAQGRYLRNRELGPTVACSIPNMPDVIDRVVDRGPARFVVEAFGEDHGICRSIAEFPTETGSSRAQGEIGANFANIAVRTGMTGGVEHEKSAVKPGLVVLHEKRPRRNTMECTCRIRGFIQHERLRFGGLGRSRRSDLRDCRPMGCGSSRIGSLTRTVDAEVRFTQISKKSRRCASSRQYALPRHPTWALTAISIKLTGDRQNRSKYSRCSQSLISS